MAPQGQNTGIRNAEVRYKKRVDDLLTSSQIRARTEETERAGGHRSRSQRVGGLNQRSQRVGGRNAQIIDFRTQKDFERVFREEGLEYEQEDLKAIVTGEKPEDPDFPFVILFVAVIKDFLDTLDLTGVGAVLTTIFSIIVGGILLMWMFRHFSGPPWKKKHAEKMAKWLLAAIGTELVPFLKIIPTNTVWVLMNHYSETQLAQSLNRALSRLPAQVRNRILNRAQLFNSERAE